MLLRHRTVHAPIMLLPLILLLFSLPVHPESRDSLFIQGKTLFKEGKHKQAHEIFYRLFEMDPENPDINFMLGRASFESGEIEQAVMIYDRMLITNPGLARVRLELGRCYMRLGSFETARALFEKVLESEPPENVKQNIERYIASAKKSVRKHHVSGSLRGFTGWDDNPQVLPDSSLISIPHPQITEVELADKKASDLFYGNLLALTHRYTPHRHPFGWETTAANYNVFYDTLSGEDLNYYSIETGPWKNWEKCGARLKISQARLNREYDRYSDATGAGASFFWVTEGRMLIDSGLNYEYRDYADHGRDAHVYNISVQPVMTRKNTSFYLKTAWTREIAESNSNDSNRIELVPGISGIITGGFRYSAACQYAFTRYDETDPLFLVTREEHLTGFSAAILKKIWKKENQSISLSLDYLYNQVYSNIDLYDYSKNRITLSVSYEF